MPKYDADEGAGLSYPGSLVNRADVPCVQTVFGVLRAPAHFAGVAELVDAPDLGSGSRKGVEVRVLSPAPYFEGLP